MYKRFGSVLLLTNGILSRITVKHTCQQFTYLQGRVHNNHNKLCRLIADQKFYFSSFFIKLLILIIYKSLYYNLYYSNIVALSDMIILTLLSNHFLFEDFYNLLKIIIG